jgi:hypothetical protein
VTFRPKKQKTTISPSAVIALAFAGIIGLVALGGLVEKQFTTDPVSQAPFARQGSGSDTDRAATVSRFRAKMMEFEYANQLFAGIEPGVTSGVVNIQVTNFWFGFKPYQKRQLTTMITNNWQQEAGTASVIVHIYDQTGHEVAGNSPLSGVWIDNE